MDVENILNECDVCLAKVVRKYLDANVIDYKALENFVNFLECLPEIEDSKNTEDELICQVEDIIYNKMWRTRKSMQKKLHLIVDLFEMLRIEHENESNEHINTTNENIFLWICTFAYTMLMFAP